MYRYNYKHLAFSQIVLEVDFTCEILFFFPNHLKSLLNDNLNAFTISPIPNRVYVYGT